MSQSMSQTTLAGFQDNFAEALMRTDAVAFPGLPTDDAQLTEKFSIYRNNVWHSLSSALMGILPVSVQLVGEDFFRAMATTYAKAHLPESGHLIGYGNQLADFVRDFPPAQSVPYLADVIALEFARHHAYHAADQSPLSMARLAAVPPEEMGQLRFSLSDSATLLSSPLNSYGIWLAHQSADPAAALAKVKIDVFSDVLIFRQDFTISVEAIDPALWRLLSRFAGGEALEDALSSVTDQYPQCDAQSLLVQALSLGCLVG